MGLFAANGAKKVITASPHCDLKFPEVPATSCPFFVNMITDACSSLEKQDYVEIKELFGVAGGESISYNSNSGFVD
ncbi:MAG: hypothetical protein WAN11_12575 [Syntrophobacteraceae bacterium]